MTSFERPYRPPTADSTPRSAHSATPPAPAHTLAGSWRMLGWLALSEFLAMTLWFSATASGPAIASEFHLNDAQAAWLTMAVQAGFVAGAFVSAVANLPDVLNARRLFAIGCTVGALSNAALTTASDAGQAILWRGVTGFALACVYPPGMKIAAGWFERRRGTALGVLVGALTVGSAFPHLLAWLAAAIPWRTSILTASVAALAGAVLIVTLVRDGPYVIHTARFDPRAVSAVFATRGTRLATLGYLGHMWELYAMWAWIAVFATASLQTGGGGRAGAGSLAAFGAIAAGAIGCVLAGLLADRFGKARVAAWAMIVSGSCAALAGVAFGASWPLLVLLVIVWGFAVVADSAQFSALVAQYSPRQYVGTALTVQTCSGFLLTMVTIRLVPVVAATLGWRWSFLVLVPGPALGAMAMLSLARTHEAESD